MEPYTEEDMECVMAYIEENYKDFLRFCEAYKEAIEEDAADRKNDLKEDK